VALLGVLTSAYYANQANQNASSAAEDAKNADTLASSAFSIANNYPPSIVVRNYTTVVLRPVDCVPNSPLTVQCELSGSFNLNFSIIAPHTGRYNVYIVGIDLDTYPKPVAYFANGSLVIVKSYNVTIWSYPDLQTVPYQGDVPANQPLEQNIEVKVTAFNITAPSNLVGSMKTIQLGRVSTILVYTDIQNGTQTQTYFVNTIDILFD
jgi:hypothetical protein